jgi:hypothetical protein
MSTQEEIRARIVDQMNPEYENSSAVQFIVNTALCEKIDELLMRIKKLEERS